MAVLDLQLTTSDFSATTLAAYYELSGDQQKNIQALVNLFKRLNAGNMTGTLAISVPTNAVAASGTITAASVQAGDTVTVGGTTVTAHASTTSSTLFALGASDTACAANLATCLGLNATISAQFSAAAASGVCTITCLTPGVVGNACALASSNNTRLAKVAFASGAADAGAVSFTF